MRWLRQLPLVFCLLAGCSGRALVEPPPITRQASLVLPVTTRTTELQRASLEVPAPVAIAEAPFAADELISIDRLVREVLARNPTISQMTAAAQAAAARYPQVTSLDDPMLGGSLGPASFGSNSVSPGYRIEVSQKLPSPGKRALRGENAQAETRAAENQIDEARLQLVESARAAFADYFLAERALDLNREIIEQLREIRKDAVARFKADVAFEQEVLLTEVEIGRQQERQIAIERGRQVAMARINTLMHLRPDSPLPKTPNEAPIGEPLLDTASLRELARMRRPDLRALENKIAADQAALALAQREYKPDFEVMAAYDTFWQETPLRAQLSLRMNIPVRYARRNGAVAEAAARLAERKAELARQIDQINFEVEQAVAQLRESEKTMDLYRKTILPAARNNVKAASAAYSGTKIPFLGVVEAQRSLTNMRERLLETSAEYLRRSATLERLIGGPINGAKPAQPPELPKSKQ